MKQSCLLIRIIHIALLIEGDINFSCGRLLTLWAIFFATASVTLDNTRDKNESSKMEFLSFRSLQFSCVIFFYNVSQYNF